MRQGAVKILDQRIKIGRVLRLRLHLEIPLLYRLRHLTLAHVFPHDDIACVDRLPDTIEHLAEICLADAEARRAEEKELLIPQFLQQRQRGAVRIPLIRPESDIKQLRIRRRVLARAEIIAGVLWQRLAQRVGKLFRVARHGAEYDRLSFLIHMMTSLSTRV